MRLHRIMAHRFRSLFHRSRLESDMQRGFDLHIGQLTKNTGPAQNAEHSSIFQVLLGWTSRHVRRQIATPLGWCSAAAMSTSGDRTRWYHCHYSGRAISERPFCCQPSLVTKLQTDLVDFMMPEAAYREGRGSKTASAVHHEQEVGAHSGGN